MDEQMIAGCPICGEEPKLTVRGNAAGYQCRSKTHLIWTYGTNQFEALANWNRRAAHSVAGKVAELEVKAISYDHAHEDAVEMGYPSLTEALEHLDELREQAALAPHPKARNEHHE